MAKLWIYGPLVILMVLTPPIQSQKILSDRKKCGDPQCESLMMRVSAKQDYSGPDCRFLRFKAGDEINVYYKLTGRREDLWQGSKGKAYGFFPKDAVIIEEVYLNYEIEIPAQEIDFVCLDGGEYVFENEDSVLHSMDENAEDPNDYIQQKGAHPTEESPDVIFQETPEPRAPEKESWAPSGIAGWFGMGKNYEKKDTETEGEMVNLEIMNEKSKSQEPTEDARLEKSSWLGGRIKNILPFGEQKDESQAKDIENYVEIVSTTTQQADQEQEHLMKDNEDSKSKWFNFRIRDVLGFGTKSEKKEEATLIVEETNNDTIPQNVNEVLASDSNLMPDPTEIPRMDQGGKTVDVELKSHIQAEDTIEKNTLEKDNHAKKFSNPKEIHQSNAHIEDVLTRIESNFQKEEGKYEERRPKEAENPSQTLEFTDDSAEHRPETIDNNEYQETLSQNLDGYGHKHVVDQHAKGEVHYLKELHLEDALAEKDNNFYDDKPKLKEAGHSQTLEDSNLVTFEETFNTMNTQEQDEKHNDDDHTSLTTHHLINEPELANIGEATLVPMTVEATVQETSEELKRMAKNSIESEEQSTCTTRMDQDCMSGLTVDPTRVGHHSLTTKSIYTTEVKTWVMGGMEVVRPLVQTDSQSAKGHAAAQLESQEDTESMERWSDISKSSEEELYSHCDVEEAAGTGEHCTATKPSHQSYSQVLAFTVMLKKLFSDYSQVLSHYLGPLRLQVTSTITEVVSLLPDDLQPGADFYGCSWDVVIFTALFGFLSVLMFTCRTLRCIKSRFYVSRECKLGNQVAEALSSKREVLEKLSLVQKQYEDVEQKLKESGHQRLLTEISEQKAVQESLQASNKELEESISKLERELEEEKQRGSELDNTLAELTEKIKSLEDNIKKDSANKEETRTTQKVFEINKGRLESSILDAAEEKSHLEESIKQLSKEAEGWEERFSELSENSRILSSSVGVMQEDLNSKQSHIKSLIENLLSLKDWSSELDEINDEEDNDVLSGIKWEFENGEPLGDPQKQRIKKLIYAAMLNASLKSLESEKKHLCDNLSDEMKAKEQLAECITNLQNTSQSLSHEKGQLEEEVEKLKQKMNVMMEVYQENERKLHRKLTVQEKERIQKEAKLSKADEKMNMATTELVTVKTRVSELEEEMDKTVSSYQNQVTSYEKKSHDNWLTARAAERYLSDVKKETAHFRQKLTEAEYKLELLEKDPFALDVIQAIGRAYADAFINHQENSPFGMSPINRHPESRAFLSPPTLLEGPLRLSPMLPGADRGVRPQGYYPGYPGPKERGDVNSERRADHQRTLSDAGSLSPPWDREQRNNVPPPGLPYPEPPFPHRRTERFYHYPPPSGRFSGPAELTRNQGRPFMDSADGRSSPEHKARMNTSRNGEEEANNVSGASSQDNEVMDGPPGEFPMHPPPSMRVPLLPRDPRAPYFRRPLMPPPPMEMYGPPGYPGMPPPHMPMRSPVPPPPHHYPAYPMHGELYFPPQPIRPPIMDSAPPPTSSLPPQDKLPDQTT
ncbi:hypothetical protein GDO81_015471 [Engystomops pustulosus]|uniref:SH3 domain-containing protein n=1 Tax=Engystomops pustulosus TaxID=76066 RepID=A0AAV7AQU8_ENGPU|nr:hypothetical protein GDO81_015471 [Engystomops pustulosus]